MPVHHIIPYILGIITEKFLVIGVPDTLIHFFLAHTSSDTPPRLTCLKWMQVVLPIRNEINVELYLPYLNVL